MCVCVCVCMHMCVYMEGSFIIMSKNLFYFKKFYEMPLKMKSHILCASVCVCMHMCVSMEGNFIILSKKRFYLNKFYEMPLKIKSHILCASVCVFSCVFICTRVWTHKICLSPLPFLLRPQENIKRYQICLYPYHYIQYPWLCGKEFLDAI